MRKLGIIKEKMETEEMADMDEKRFAIKETVSAKEIKMLRKKLGLTQRDFARLLDCSKPTVERLEREGTVTKGPMALLIKLLDRDTEYIHSLEIPPRELPVRMWYMYKDTPCTLIDVDECEKSFVFEIIRIIFSLRHLGLKKIQRLKITMNFWNPDVFHEQEIR